MYLEFKRHSGISLSTGDLATGTPGGVSAAILLPEGVSTSSLDSARSRTKKPTIDRTIKPMSASVGGISHKVAKVKGELDRFVTRDRARLGAGVHEKESCMIVI